MYKKITIWLTFLLSIKALAIIDGTHIEKLNGPVVALQMKYKKDGKTIYRKGTAFAVTPRKLLTAGHNAFYIKNPNDIEVILSTSPCWGINSCNEKRITVLKKIVHPNFENNYPAPPVFDLAILELEENLPKSIDLIPLHLSDNKLKNFSVLGFGMSKASSRDLSDFKLRIYRYLESSLNFVSQQKTSLPQDKGGFCGGDSGAPLLGFDKKGVQKALGIAIHNTKDSAGKFHCLTSGVFTYLPFFKLWLNQNL